MSLLACVHVHQRRSADIAEVCLVIRLLVRAREPTHVTSVHERRHSKICSGRQADFRCEVG